jgi:hypothetical protein
VFTPERSHLFERNVRKDLLKGPISQDISNVMRETGKSEKSFISDQIDIEVTQASII